MSADQTTTNGEWTIARLLQWTIGHFGRHNVDEPRLSAELLLSHALGCSRIHLYTQFEQVPAGDRLDVFRELVREAANHRPIAYLLGKKEFYSLEFAVSSAVLIPRPETEMLVQRALDVCRGMDRERIDILDLGTGSGCIGITLCVHCPAVWVVGSDLSREALEMAAANAARHNVAERFRTVAVDKLDFSAEVVPQGGWHIIVSNPPYIADSQIETLDRNVREYEPRAALSAGPDGLLFYRTLARDSGKLLTPGGSVLVEVGHDQHERVAGLFAESSIFQHVGTWKDRGAAHERVMQFSVKKGKADS